MKIIEKWNEVDRRQAGAGMQVLYELGGYRIAVSDASYMPGGLSITAYPINRDSYSPEIYVGQATAKPSSGSPSRPPPGALCRCPRSTRSSGRIRRPKWWPVKSTWHSLSASKLRRSETWKE